jgi:hypothetical protein
MKTKVVFLGPFASTTTILSLDNYGVQIIFL